MSPQRVNILAQQQSPEMASIDPFVVRTPTGDVQGKVAQFNNLSKASAHKRKESEAALRRAVVGREEAESEARRLKDENQTLKQKLEEVRAREIRVQKKFEVFGEEKRTLIDHQHKCQKISEQEVRRARKEAFKYSSALVQAQEDVQKARGHMEELREQANVERHRGQKYQQEAFDAQLGLASAEEEVQGLKRKLSAVEDERNALRTNLDDEHLARIAAEGMLPLPPACDPEDEFASPRKSKARRISARRESLKENMDPSWKSSNDIFDIMWAAEEGDEFAIAKRNLWVEEKRRQEAELMITYLKAEYEHRPCSCKKAISQAQDHVKQGMELYVETTTLLPPAPTVDTLTNDGDEKAISEDTIVHHSPQPDLNETLDSGMKSPSIHSEPPLMPALRHEQSFSLAAEAPTFAIHEDNVDFSTTADASTVYKPTRKLSPIPKTAPVSTTMDDFEANKENSLEPAEQSMLSIKSEDIETSASYSSTPRYVKEAVTEPVKPINSRQVTPVYTSHTTTISIPLKTGESPVKKQDFPFSPGATMTREQALAAIKQRRGRAKSAHGTARTPMGKADFRNISSKSAPAM